MRSRAYPERVRYLLLLLATWTICGCQAPLPAPDATATPLIQDASNAGCTRCHSGHTAPLPTDNPMMRGLSDLDPARPDGLHSCTSCHGGTPQAQTIEAIHSGGLPHGMIPAFAPNPTSAEAVMYACGMCHRNHVRRVDNSAMNGYGINTSNINNLPAKPDAAIVGSKTYRDAHGTATGPRPDCAGACHIFDKDVEQQGCASCHMPRGSALHKEHKLAGQVHPIDPSTCMQCHNGGHQLGLRYLGQQNDKPAKVARTPWQQIEVGHKADLHARAGMVCQDCHSSIDIHGDGTASRGTEIECSDCHGTAEQHPWELPPGAMDRAVTAQTPARGTTRRILSFQRHGVYVRGADHLITARGNPLQHSARYGDAVTLQSWSGMRFDIPQLRHASEAARTLHRQHSYKLECFACHTALTNGTVEGEAGLLAPLVPGVTYTDGQQVAPAAKNPHDTVARPDASACQACHAE